MINVYTERLLRNEQREGYKMDGKRFVRVFKQWSLSSDMEIWMDRVTGVHYLYRQNGYSGGLTVLVDRDGKPVTGGPEEWE